MIIIRFNQTEGRKKVIRVLREAASTMMTRRKKRSCSNQKKEEEKSERIPFDLVIEILLRLPVKSIARFRYVSKLWQSTLRGQHFTESYLTISSSRPKILFTCLKDCETFFFSSPHPQDLSPIAANLHMSFPISCPSNICRPVRGWLCGLHQRTTKGTTVTEPLICNPSTGESVVLRKVKTRRKGVISFLGFDPIDKNFKVLCMTRSCIGRADSEEHQVHTLETGKKPSRKMIECDILHYPVPVEHTNGFSQYDGVCINGVLYYLAIVHGVSDDRYPDVVCFEFGSDKFKYIKKVAGHDMEILYLGRRLNSILVNYKGKLAKLQPNMPNNVCTGIQLWVLEDAEKHEWSSHIYVLPPPWRNVYEETKLCFVGTTRKGEIVLSPNTISDFFYLLYYNPDRNTITIVKIKGMETFQSHKAYTFLDHLEDVNLVPIWRM
ncbi:F-box and associated interaction domains-containing protein [Arabidopsis thaliana]|nr:F-box and associated interaction domains-containing protein [Arabidopsis thaliana]ANM65297.1 F-box and associated interaction domains-containing protein [Arabidopsis thaliana]|eukprot:NP_001327275.1 F-box and associated interaction domains-containing protein [Arabidopsis thaliana]